MTIEPTYSKQGALDILKQLEEAYARRDLLQLQKAEAVPAEVKQILEDIETEFVDRIETNSNLIADLEAEAKKIALQFGETVSGENIQVIYKKGSVTISTKADCRKPSTQLRRGRAFINTSRLTLSAIALPHIYYGQDTTFVLSRY